MPTVLGLGEGAGGVDLQRERGGGRHHLWGDGGGGGAERRRRGEGQRGGRGTHEAHGADRAGQLVIAVEEVSLEGLLEAVVVWGVRAVAGVRVEGGERGSGRQNRQDKGDGVS